MKNLLLFLLILAIGCAGKSSTEAGYQARLEELRGVHIDEVVMAWGPPDGEFTFEDGRKMYAFVDSRQVSYQHVGPATVRMRRVYGPRFYNNYPVHRIETREYFCETRFIADKEGRIQEWNFRGNACKALPPQPDTIENNN